MNGIIPFQEIEVFADENGKEPFTNWILKLDITTQRRIRERLRRIELGNFGDYRRIDEDLYELRFHFGAGYRVYYAKINKKLVLLLGGGDKASQIKDITLAKFYYEVYKEQTNEKIQKV